jgi:hypothetical protein
MQSDVLYDLALRVLSGEDGTIERLKDAELAQFAAPAANELAEEPGMTRSGRDLRFFATVSRRVRPADT